MLILFVKNKNDKIPIAAVIVKFDRNRIKPAVLSTTAKRKKFVVINLNALLADEQKFKL